VDNGKIENFENVVLGGCNEIKHGLQVNFEEEACNLSIDYPMFGFTRLEFKFYIFKRLIEEFF